ncbi:hypothetical protein L1857_12310 [Amycolatopsis thermalba]|uniref:Uncharacterized protein n=1 Tax=Amycolatopsis thermalba TaxID=944492 RepID=A0ABY4NU15_9PSEU|nr:MULTISPECIES: hypothetical protein [Amycolatopsis]UQS23549.1 hypothetical protein L1857_12310 [Amycolatopsis thermalba]
MARALPFWFSREIGTYAIEGVDSGCLVRGVLHGVACTAVLLAAVAVASSVRLRQRTHLKFLGPR